MLFESILHVYGRSLSGQLLRPEDDMVAAVISPEARDAFPRQGSEDISAARMCVLDPEAADYADSFPNSMQDGLDTARKMQVIEAFVREVDLPADLIWVEHDHAAPLAARLKRGYKMTSDTGLDDFGPHGFLFDNRFPDHLRITPSGLLGAKGSRTPVLT